MRNAKPVAWAGTMATCGFLLLLSVALGTPANGDEIQTLPFESTHTIFLPIVSNPPAWTDCSQSEMGSILITLQDFQESTGPELVTLALNGYVGLTGTPTYDTGAQYFPLLQGWDRVQICNSHECLRTRSERAASEGLEYEYLGYGPERLDGVPPEEKYNLPWATQVAREIADQSQKPLMLSYSTTQLHQEAEERGFGWDNPGQVVQLLAPYGDIWLIQAADEYNDPYSNPEHPDLILSQRHYPPGPEWRAEVEKWVNWIKDASPDIEIWIQLALHRIPAGPPPWEDNYPSAELLLEYREWLVSPQYGPPLVDGVYVTSVYSWPIDPIVADQEMEIAIRWACGQESHLVPSTPTTPSSAPVTEALADISLIEEGWTDGLEVAGITVLPGYYYRIYENSRYPCGAEGNHQFMVLDSSRDAGEDKHLFAKFLGGAVGFWYNDSEGNRTYYPQESAVGLLNAVLNRNWMFRTTVSEEFANGITKRFRDNRGFRILVPSYCSHDFYHGTGQCDSTDGFCRFGYLAAMEAMDYVQQNFATTKVIVYGGSAGAAGFYVGKDQNDVAGIIMDSQAIDMSAIRDACYGGYDAFGGAFPCFCPEGGVTCMEVLAPRIGFSLGSDEPYHFVERGEVDTPIFLIWNYHDASSNAHYQYDNLHHALRQYDPGGGSVACRVCLPHADPSIPDSCIQDDNYIPLGSCNLHVPSAWDYDFTTQLVQDVYSWALDQVGDLGAYKAYLPCLVRESYDRDYSASNKAGAGWDRAQ
mgnify:CR=1 FL=1